MRIETMKQLKQMNEIIFNTEEKQREEKNKPNTTCELLNELNAY